MRLPLCLCVSVLLCLCASPALTQTREIAIRQIVLPTEQAAEETRARLLAGTSFEALAAERSQDPTARRGGYLGRMRLSDLRNEVRLAVEQIGPGEVSTPVHVGNTYILFQLVPEAESRWIELDEAGAQALADGRRAEALEHFEKALAHAEAAALGDARLARSLDTLATLYRLDGRSGEAEKLYRRTLAVLERLGAPALEIAQVLSSLGMALVQQERFKDAEPLYARARSMREKQLGPNHPEVAATLHNTAELLAGLGRLAEAAKMYTEAQILLERALGPDHQATIAGAQSVQAFRLSLVSELLDRISTAAGASSEFRDAESVARIQELLPLTPLSEHAYVQIKDILSEAGLIDDTEEVLRTGLSKFPDSRILRIYLADLLAATGRTQNALAVLEEASKLRRPERLDMATELQQQAVISQRIGDIHSALNDFEKALASYRRALEIDAATPAGRIKLGKAFFSAGRLEEARVEFERALEQTPENNEVHLNLAETHLAAGRWEPAVTAAEHAIQLGASDSRALYLLGTALVRMGRRELGQERLQEFARVEAEFRKAEQRSREIRAISINTATALRDGSGKSAVEQLTAAIARYPESALLRMNLATVLSRLGHHEMSVEVLESMLQLGIGRRFLIHKNLADEYRVLGNADASGRHRKIYLETRETELATAAR